MDHATSLEYLYFNVEFKIYTNAINFQLVALINQKEKRISFHSRKLNDAQIRYT